jgi:hypothetical protein
LWILQIPKPHGSRKTTLCIKGTCYNQEVTIGNSKSILHLSMVSGLCLTRQFHSGTGHCMCGAYVLNSMGPTSMYIKYVFFVETWDQLCFVSFKLLTPWGPTNPFWIVAFFPYSKSPSLWVRSPYNIFGGR